MKNKERFVETVNFCDSVCQKTFKHIASLMSKEEDAREMLALLTTSCFLAGGAIRSHLTKTKINDYDFFFTTPYSLHQFIRLIASNKTRLISSVTSNGCYDFHVPELDAKASFITRIYGNPKNVVDSFDFSFNSHFFFPKNYTFEFDVDTLEKKGHLVSTFTNRFKMEKILSRLIRFIMDGYVFNTQTFTQIFKQTKDIYEINPTGYSREYEDAFSNDQIQNKAFKADLTYNVVTEQQIFNQKGGPEPMVAYGLSPTSLYSTGHVTTDESRSAYINRIATEHIYNISRGTTRTLGTFNPTSVSDVEEFISLIDED